MERIDPHSKLSHLLRWCEDQAVSDLHLQAQAIPRVRVEGRLKKVDPSICPVLTPKALFQFLEAALSPSTYQQIFHQREVDLSMVHGGTRYRANFSRQQGNPSCSFRRVPSQDYNLADLRLPSSLAEFVNEPRGLILAAGPTGQGKSTTMRALIQTINQTRSLRIISIEDPIEYVFTAQESQIEQREVGIDTESFETGIRNAMRQDPDVIFVGEIRDRPSIHAAMQAAETGHLVLTTLHADSTSQAIARICELYPSGEQSNITGLLARQLRSVVCQRLIPDVHDRLVPCIELMRQDHGIEKAIREKNLTLLSGIIEAAIDQGMHSFDQYLQELLIAGVIHEKTARNYAVNRHRLDLNLRGIETTAPILFTGERSAAQ